MKVEVAFALPDIQAVTEIELQAPATVADALLAAREKGFLREIEDRDVWDGAVGIFGEAVEVSRLLKEGDRVELYRGLSIDPKQARRRRAEARTRR